MISQRFADDFAAEQFAPGTGGSPQTIGQIWQEAEKLQRHNERMALDLAERQLEAAIFDDLARSGIAFPASVNVAAAIDSRGRLVIDRVTVRLSGDEFARPDSSASIRDGPDASGKEPETDWPASEASGGETIVRPVRPVAPVEPVTIVIAPIGGGEGRADEQAEKGRAREERQTAISDERIARVRGHIAQTWQLAPERIEVLGEGR